MIALALTGCASLIELERTQLDQDQDQVEDSLDNCPRDSNPNQEDIDGDNVGDACSECTDPIERDLDRDGRDDGCDGCVGTGLTNVDIDEDGRDDGCDACIFEGTFDAYSLLAVDDDGDGIADGCDTCIGQVGVDIDRDDIDDVCDSCLNGPPSDQDHDTVEDGCDNCPLDANLGQENLGGEDELGAACDLDDPYSDARVVFDGFYAVTPDQWQFTSPSEEPTLPYGWALERSAAGDHLHQVVTMAPAQAILQDWFTQIGTYGSYSIRVRGWFDDPAQAGGEFGIAMSGGSTTGGSTGGTLDPPMGVGFAYCTVTRSGALTLAGPSIAISMPGVETTAPMTLRLLAVSDGVGGCSATCAVVDQPATAITTTGVPDLCLGGTVGVAIKNDATTSLDWIEAIVRSDIVVGPSPAEPATVRTGR